MRGSGLNLDEIREFADVFQFPDLGQREFDMEPALDRHQQPNVAQAVPAGDVLRRKFPVQHEVVVVEYVPEYLRQRVQRVFFSGQKTPRISDFEVTMGAREAPLARAVTDNPGCYAGPEYRCRCCPTSSIV